MCGCMRACVVHVNVYTCVCLRVLVHMCARVLVRVRARVRVCGCELGCVCVPAGMPVCVGPRVVHVWCVCDACVCMCACVSSCVCG